jgi:hypothetical protein
MSLGIPAGYCEHPGMRTRRRGTARDSRQRHRPLERDDRGDGHLEENGTAGSTEGPAVLVADPRWVQPAELVACDVDGCSARAVPEAWELVDLDTGVEAPGRLCEEHQLAWLASGRSRSVVDD